jgi:hypothetical protein
MVLVMGARTSRPRAAQTARTIRFPAPLRQKLLADAERCGRSFEAQVLAILRSHFGEYVDISTPPETVLAALRRSAEGVSDADWEEMMRRGDED